MYNFSITILQYEVVLKITFLAKRTRLPQKQNIALLFAAFALTPKKSTPTSSTLPQNPLNLMT